MRIGIDATELEPGTVGGVRTAVYLLLEALHKYARDVEVIAFAPDAIETPPGVCVRATGGPKKPRRWRKSRALAEAVRGLDLFHSPVTAFPSLDGLPVTATVHELPFVENFRLEGPTRALKQWYWLSRAMGRCAALFVPSNATLQQLRLAHPAAARLAHVVPHPAPHPPESEQHGHDGSLLFVGRLDKRKCVEALLAGAAALDGEIRLVGPQKETDRMRIGSEAKRVGVFDRLIFMGVVDDPTLDYLYRKASVVALLSASEGFGFPVLEALARGVPVVVAKGTGAAEVGGDAVQAVDTTRREEIAAALRRAQDPEYRATIAVRGPARALEFPAEKTARGYVEVFRRATAR